MKRWLRLIVTFYYYYSLFFATFREASRVGDIVCSFTTCAIANSSSLATSTCHHPVTFPPNTYPPPQRLRSSYHSSIHHPRLSHLPRPRYSSPSSTQDILRGGAFAPIKGNVSKGAFEGRSMTALPRYSPVPFRPICRVHSHPVTLLSHPVPSCPVLPCPSPSRIPLSGWKRPNQYDVTLAIVETCVCFMLFSSLNSPP